MVNIKELRIHRTRNMEVERKLGIVWGIYVGNGNMMNKKGELTVFWNMHSETWRELYCKTRREAIMYVKRFHPEANISYIQD